MIDLPKNEHTFDFNEIGEMTGNKYEGKFTVYCILNLGLRHALEVERSRLQRDMMNPTVGLSNISFLLSNLRVRIINGPAWWDESNSGATILDDNIMRVLLDKVLEAEDIWKKKLEDSKKKSEEQ